MKEPIFLHITWWYLDPGSGSLIIQMALAGLLGAGLLIKIYWKKVYEIFKKDKKDDPQAYLENLDEYDE
jgi:hypothetical protein